MLNLWNNLVFYYMYYISYNKTPKIMKNPSNIHARGVLYKFIRG